MIEEKTFITVVLKNSRETKEISNILQEAHNVLFLQEGLIVLLKIFVYDQFLKGERVAALIY